MKIITVIMTILLKLGLYIIGSIIYVLATAFKLLSYTTKIIKLLVILICVLMSIVIFTLFISDDLEGISLLMIVAFYIFSAVVYSLIYFVNIMSVKLKQTANKCFKIACNKSKRKKNNNNIDNKENDAIGFSITYTESVNFASKNLAKTDQIQSTND